MANDNEVESWEDLIKDEDGLDCKPNNLICCLNKTQPASNVKILNKNSTTTSAAPHNRFNRTEDDPVLNDSSTMVNPDKGVKVTFEDDMRTQFIPQLKQKSTVKILQRPKAESKDGLNDSKDLIKNGFFNAKTIQEREAEYARARARILGTNYGNDQTELSTTSQLQSIDSCEQLGDNHQANKKNNINLVRAPIGPSKQAGFTQKR